MNVSQSGGAAAGGRPGCPHERRSVLRLCLVALLAGEVVAVLAGCSHHRYGHILGEESIDLVGSHDAGAAVWNPLVDEAVARMLSRCPPRGEPVDLASFGTDPATGLPLAAMGQAPGASVGMCTVCFVGIENKSAEELHDFKDQIYERIDSQINGAPQFRSVSRRMVDAALLETRLRPDSLFLPGNRDLFAASLGRQGMPIDTLMYATITSGTTDRNNSTQRDYLLTLEMVNLHNGDYVKESAKIRKGYHKTRAGKWWNFGLGQGDG